MQMAPGYFNSVAENRQQVAPVSELRACGLAVKASHCQCEDQGFDPPQARLELRFLW